MMSTLRVCVCVFYTNVHVRKQLLRPLLSQSMTPHQWGNHLVGTELDVVDSWWGSKFSSATYTRCTIVSLSLGNEFDNPKKSVNKRRVFRIKRDKEPERVGSVDPDDPDIVEGDPFPIEDEKYYYDDMEYEAVLEYVDKKQANYRNLHLPEKSLVTSDIQVRILTTNLHKFTNNSLTHDCIVRLQIVLSVG